MGSECTYCGSDIDRHSPVFVDDQQGAERVQTGQFCNYACLSAYIDDRNLTRGARCEIDR